ncbi:unnamed protein product [Closterium sp. Naga37s-1]|nr:unnamed protein product [Closterium sp. Naga37s-1]
MNKEPVHAAALCVPAPSLVYFRQAAVKEVVCWGKGGLLRKSPVDDMASESVTSAVNDLMKEAVLAAVREELAAHKEEVDESRHMLTAVNGELAVVKGELAVVKGELAVVKGELAVVKGELGKHKEQRVEISIMGQGDHVGPAESLYSLR